MTKLISAQNMILVALSIQNFLLKSIYQDQTSLTQIKTSMELKCTPILIRYSKKKFDFVHFFVLKSIITVLDICTRYFTLSAVLHQNLSAHVKILNFINVLKLFAIVQFLKVMCANYSGKLIAYFLLL